MANPEHLAKLKEGAEAWNRWRADNPETSPQLSEAELEGVGLAGGSPGEPILRANLEGADLRGAKLGHAKLKAANLVRARLAKADLSYADLREVELREADLEDTVLTAANLSEANLSDATLTNSNLGKTVLEYTDFGDADLGGADLMGANLIATHLDRADLRGARLGWATFNGASLRETDFEGAQCFGTGFVSLDLSVAKGLSQIAHEGPSMISLDTMARSNGNIPTDFLRGCGLADWEVETAKLYKSDLLLYEKTDILYQIDHLFSGSPIQISPLFISYSWTDSEFVDKLGEKLDELDIRYWRDKKDATAGRLDKVIDRGIRLNPTLLLILSENSVNAPWVEYEVGKAVDLSRELTRDVLCPIALDDSWAKSTRMSGQLRSQIKKYSVLSFEDWKNQDSFEREMKKLIEGLNLHYRGGTNVSAEPERG